MIKPFFEALRDGFKHITHISLLERKKYNLSPFDEGFWEYSFGENKEFTFKIEPGKDENEFIISILHIGQRLIPKLQVWAKPKN